MNQHRTSINPVVREDNHQPAKKINIVSIKLVRESSMLYKMERFQVQKMHGYCLNST